MLSALCLRMTQSEGDGEVHAAAIESRLAGEHAIRRRIARLLVVFDHPVTAVLCGGRPIRFTALTPAAQERVLHGWATSRLPRRRAALEALRRIVLSTVYSLPSEAAAIGHRGPLHMREPLYAWEGPVPGVASGDEPVARPSQVPVARAPVLHGIVQGSELPARSVVRADVCVIGSGAGGAAAAARLAEAGRDVVVLEEGGHWAPEDFTENEAQMVARLYADAGLRATTDLGLSLLQGRCVGGGTTVNWMIMLRPPDWVMEEWSRAHGAELLAASQLVPALERVEEEVHARRVPDDAHDPPNRVILDGSAALGWKAEPARINAIGCVRAGTCGLGCRYRAKQGALETYLPRALSMGARLFSDVRADRLECEQRPGGLKRIYATVLERATRSGRGELIVEAPVVVIAAGAVGTPILLQRSDLGGGGVGRFLRLHPTTGVVGLYPRAMYAAAGIPQSSVCMEFLDRNGGYGFWIECPPLLPGLGAAGLPGFGAAHRARIRDFERLAPLIVLVRDGAEGDRSQGSVVADRTGAPHIRFRLGAAERRTLADGIHAAVRMHHAAGAETVLTLHDRAHPVHPGDDIDWILRANYSPGRIGLFSAHVNGTCRMGTDPRTSGCSPDAERHGAPGIYIADGSVLPTAPGANPQALILAIGGLVADRVLERSRVGG